MKKFLVMAVAAVSLVACNDADGDNASTDMDTTSTTTTTTTTSTSANDAYSPVDGDVTYQENKVRVRRNGEWVDAEDDVKLDNGVVVYRDGRAVRDGKEVRLEDGEVVDRTGRFFDRTGKAIENAWDDVKEGAKDAGRAIGNAAEKVGEKAKNAVDNDNN